MIVSRKLLVHVVGVLKRDRKGKFPASSSLQCRRFLLARNLLAKAPCWNFPKRGGDIRGGTVFYSLQSSTVIKSKMAATTTLRTRTRFCPPKICLHCRLCYQRRLFRGIWIPWKTRLCELGKGKIVCERMTRAQIFACLSSLLLFFFFSFFRF